jgi:L-serine deaminase
VVATPPSAVSLKSVKRNAMGASQAFISADMALAGIRSVIPPDEVVEAMYKVSQMSPITFFKVIASAFAAISGVPPLAVTKAAADMALAEPTSVV